MTNFVSVEASKLYVTRITGGRSEASFLFNFDDYVWDGC